MIISYLFLTNIGREILFASCYLFLYNIRNINQRAQNVITYIMN